jgi:peptide/nickel transport system substrate-binding protein
LIFELKVVFTGIRPHLGILSVKGSMSDERAELSRRSYLTLAGAGAASASLAGCSGSDSEAQSTTETESGTETESDSTTESDGEATDSSFPVTVTQGEMATTLDPHDHRETSTRSVLLQMYERIIFRNGEGNVVNRLATEWERVADGEVRFTIREGVEFHDGQSLTAEDCAYSIRRVVDDDVHITSPQSGQLAGITGAEARSETDLRVFSDGFNPVVIASLASYCPVVSQEWTEAREPSEVAQETNGTGPFRLVEYESDVSVEIESFDNYWGEEPAVTSGTINAASESSTRVNSLRTGETDVSTNVPPQDAATIQDEEGVRIDAVPSTRNLFVVLNYGKEPFDSREFRQAMNYAIDLNSIIENVLNGFG